MKTIAEFNKQLKEQGTLSTLLKPEDFAPDDALAATIAQRFDRDLKPNQTRRIFHTIKQLERNHVRDKDSDKLGADDSVRLTLLAPELAYAAGRKLIPLEFYEVLKTCLQSDKLKTVGDLRRLTQFLSAIVAYQKYQALIGKV